MNSGRGSSGSAAPAFAATGEPVACTVGPVTAQRASWTMTGGGLALWDMANTGWLPVDASGTAGPNRPATQDWHSQGPGFVTSADQATANAWTTLVVTYQIPTIAGADYTAAFDVKSLYAGGEGGAERQDVTAVLTNGTQSVTMAKVATDGTNTALSDAQMTADGWTVSPNWAPATTYTQNFTAQQTGFATLVFTFRLHPVPVVKTPAGINQPGWYANRDMWVSVPRTNLDTCPA